MNLNLVMFAIFKTFLTVFSKNGSLENLSQSELELLFRNWS